MGELSTLEKKEQGTSQVLKRKRQKRTRRVCELISSGDRIRTAERQSRKQPKRRESSSQRTHVEAGKSRTGQIAIAVREKRRESAAVSSMTPEQRAAVTWMFVRRSPPSSFSNTMMITSSVS